MDITCYYQIGLVRLYRPVTDNYHITYLHIYNVSIIRRVTFVMQGTLETRTKTTKQEISYGSEDWNNGKKVSMKTLLSFTTLRPTHFGQNFQEKVTDFRVWLLLLRFENENETKFWWVGHVILCTFNLLYISSVYLTLWRTLYIKLRKIFSMKSKIEDETIIW